MRLTSRRQAYSAVPQLDPEYEQLDPLPAQPASSVTMSMALRKRMVMLHSCEGWLNYNELRERARMLRRITQEYNSEAGCRVRRRWDAVQASSVTPVRCTGEKCCRIGLGSAQNIVAIRSAAPIA